MFTAVEINKKKFKQQDQFTVVEFSCAFNHRRGQIKDKGRQDCFSTFFGH